MSRRPTRSRGDRGLALVTVLLFSVVLLMMVIALYRAVQGELFVSQNFRDLNAATFLAEAGVMEAVAELEADPAWTEGFENRTVVGVPGTFTVVFNTSGSSFSPHESVNNSDGSTGDNYRGIGMVPPGYVSVVCTAQVGTQSRTLEALVHLGGDVYPADSALVSSGKIDMRGDIAVDGRAAIGDPTRVAGDVHSDLSDPGDGIITYDGSGTASFDGLVATVGAAAAAVDLAGALPTGGVQTGASAKNPPDVNILAKIAANAGAPAASVNATGTTALSPVGESTKLFYNGDLVITDGDLVLNGVELYVNGSVNITGSITGDGTLYVGGKTTFQGDARILAATPDKVGLFSEGDVMLTGFDGTAYMNGLAAEGKIDGKAWEQLGDSISDYHQKLSGPTAESLFGPSGIFDQLSHELSWFSVGSSLPTTVAGRQHDVTGKLLSQLSTLPSGPQQRQIIKKLTQLREIFWSHGNGSSAENNALANLQQGRLVEGAFDAAIDQGKTEFLPYMKSYVENIDYEHLGTAYFQGLVFTHGSFYADSEVTILGALVAKNNGSQPPSEVNGESLEPGDVVLATDTRLRYIEDFFKAKDGETSARGAKIALWVGR